MKGPIKKDIKVGFGLEGLEVATFFAGLLVVIGLLMESGPEAWTAIIKRLWPHREVTGNVLVTIGVFAEVAIGLFIARSAKRAQLQAEAQIAEVTERASRAEERAALAEQAAAEANLARIRLAQRIVRRNIPSGQIDAIAERLTQFAGQRIVICCFPFNLESATFANRVRSLLLQARWVAEERRPEGWTSPPDRTYCNGFSLSTTPDDKSMAAAEALITELGNFAGGACGAFGGLDPPARVEMVVQEKLPPSRDETEEGQQDG